ncbi:hypothetical protein AB1N83_013877 [Pleurotus pulmonarius]
MHTPLTRPFVLFFRELILQVLGVCVAFTHGVFYLFLMTIPLVLQVTYHQLPDIAGLHYIVISVASQFNARTMDRIYAHLTSKNGDNGRPEYRLLSMVARTFLLPAGLLIMHHASTAGRCRITSTGSRLTWTSVHVCRRLPPTMPTIPTMPPANRGKS